MTKDNQTKSKKKWYIRWWAILIYIFLFIKFVVFISDSQQTQMRTTTPINNQAQEQVVVNYEIIEEKDISYAGCKRIIINIIVPDNYSEKIVDYTLNKIINKYKPSWDDITVFAYKESEKEQVKTIPYTMGRKEYSICK